MAHPITTKYSGAAFYFTVMAASGKPVCLSLQGLEHLEQLNGMTYKDLPIEAQHIFLSSLISMRIVQSDASEDGLFELYTRMNTGSKNHSKQQNRRAIFRCRMSGMHPHLILQFLHHCRTHFPSFAPV